MKKKPNYKLRRRVALIVLILIILIPILIINSAKISHIPTLYKYREYKDIVNSLYGADFTNDEVRNLMEVLKKNKQLNEIRYDFIIELKGKGYSKESINYLLIHLNRSEITKLISKKYDEDLEEYIKIEDFDYDKYDRYVAYQKKHKNLKKEDIVLRVELKIDLDNYEDAEEIEDPDSLLAYVNRHRYINKNYEPSDLVEMDDKYSNNYYGVNKLRSEAYEHFKEMVDDANSQGIEFVAETTYRSFDDQETIYNNYSYEHTREETDKYAARPGYSEHELGTAIDLSNVWYIEEGDEEYEWIRKNCYKYGFIMRYKKGKEDITKYAAEDWHIRYVGVKNATLIHNKNITFDEYWYKYVKKSN
jgi:D-alanyl-D-alanine carboxypeptidase